MGKRGPAPKGEYAGQTAVLSTRISPELRSRLEAEVESTGKTLSREIEHRLRRTFIEDDKIEAAFGGRQNYALMKVIAMVLESWHNPADIQSDWRSDPVAYDQVCRKIMGVLKAMRPPGEGVALSELESAIADLKAVEDPARAIQAIQNADDALPLAGRRRDQVLSSIKGDLGSLIERPKISYGTADQLRASAKLNEKEPPLGPKKSRRKAPE
jgi:hypothetical protein